LIFVRIVGWIGIGLLLMGKMGIMVRVGIMGRVVGLGLIEIEL
jgi:hypothetical protein